MFWQQLSQGRSSSYLVFQDHPESAFEALSFFHQADFFKKESSDVLSCSVFQQRTYTVFLFVSVCVQFLLSDCSTDIFRALSDVQYLFDTSLVWLKTSMLFQQTALSNLKQVAHTACKGVVVVIRGQQMFSAIISSPNMSE